MRALLSLILLLLSLSSAPAQADRPQRCGSEDSPAWSWSQCGNHARGVHATDGRIVVVGPVRFCRLDRAGRINWKRTDRLHGDAYARTTCRR